MNYEKMTAPCGLSCFNCVVYQANENEGLRKMISKKLGIPVEKAVCRGCRHEDGNCPILPTECSVYPCVEEKGLTFCFECADFPCDKLHPYVDMAERLPHNTKVFNLCLIKKMGLESWAKDKANSVNETYFKGKWKF